MGAYKKSNAARRISISILGACGAMPVTASAVGISLMEVGVSGLGNAYAGSTVEAPDASVLFFNPAALTRLKKAEQVIGAVAIKVNASFQDSAQGSNQYPGGAVYERAASYALAPNNFLAFPLGNRWVLGLSASGSAGLIQRYPNDYPGRFQSKSTDIKVTRLNAALAYKATSSISVGMNLSLERFFESIRTDVDFAKAASAEPGLVGAGGQLLGNPLAGGVFNGLTGSASSAPLKLRLFGTKANVQAGVMFEPTDALRVGMSYRPKTTFDLNGYYTFQTPPSAALMAVAGNLLKDGSVTQRITMPSELRMSVFYQAKPSLALMADVTRFDYRGISNVAYFREDGSTLKNYVQNLSAGQRYALGLNYRPFKRLLLKAGTSYDQSISSNAYRVTALPDQARHSLNAGASLQVTEGSWVDIGYQVSKFDTAGIQDRSALQGQQSEKSFDGNLNGDVSTKAQFLGIQYHGHF